MKKIFFAYSDESEDINLYKELKLHFNPYAKKGILTIIDKDELFRISSSKEKAIEQLQTSDFAVPLLSIDYLNNEECLKLLEAAAVSNKPIIPVLLRACEWTEVERLKTLEKTLLPNDQQPVAQHISAEGGDDKILSGIAKTGKAIMFKDDLEKLNEIPIKQTPKLFYYILAGIVFLIGVMGAFISYSFWGDWKISIIYVLMFAAIAMLPLKNVWIPTKFKTN